MREVRCAPVRVQIALGIDREGRRHVLSVELSHRESESSWTECLSRLKERGLQGVDYVVSDSHEGLKHAVSKVLPNVRYGSDAAAMLRALPALCRERLSRRADPAACLEGLKRLCVCVCGGGHGIETVEEAREALGIWVDRWGEEPGYGGLVDSADYT